MDKKGVLAINSPFVLSAKAGKNLSKEEVGLIAPSREDIADIYRYLKAHNGKIQRADIIVSRMDNVRINSAKIFAVLDILQELNIGKVSIISDEFTVKINDSDKVDLSSSMIFEKLSKMKEEEQVFVITGIMNNYLTGYDWKIMLAVTLQNNLFNISRYYSDRSAFLRADNGFLFFNDMKISSLFSMFYLLYQYQAFHFHIPIY